LIRAGIDFNPNCSDNMLNLSAKLRAGLPGRRELEISGGLTIVYCETVGNFFVCESWQHLEDLLPSALREIESFLVASNKQREKNHEGFRP